MCLQKYCCSTTEAKQAKVFWLLKKKKPKSYSGSFKCSHGNKRECCIKTSISLFFYWQTGSFKMLCLVFWSEMSSEQACSHWTFLWQRIVQWKSSAAVLCRRKQDTEKGRNPHTLCVDHKSLMLVSDLRVSRGLEPGEQMLWFTLLSSDTPLAMMADFCACLMEPEHSPKWPAWSHAGNP